MNTLKSSSVQMLGFISLLCFSLNAVANKYSEQILACTLPNPNQVQQEQKESYEATKLQISYVLKEYLEQQLEDVASLCDAIFLKTMAFAKEKTNERNFDLIYRFAFLHRLIDEFLKLKIKDTVLSEIVSVPTAMWPERGNYVSKLVNSAVNKQKHETTALDLAELNQEILKAKPKYDKEHIQKNSSVNLLWIFKEAQGKNEQFIFPHPYKRQNEEIDLFLRIKQWVVHYPRVNIWYDSNFIGRDALDNTRKKIDIDIKEYADKISLKDIRKLKPVKNNEKIFTGGRSIYFRSDLARLIMSYETLIDKIVGKFFIYADMGIKPLSPDELLNMYTVYNLNTYGIILGKTPNGRVENSFHVIGNHNLALLQAIESALIDLNIKRALNSGSLKGRYFKLSGAFDQVVYDSYPAFFAVFYGLDKKADQSACGSQWRNKNEYQINDCLWQTFGEEIIFSLPIVTDKILRLQLKIWPGSYLNRFYVPTIESDKISSSHFG